MSGLLLVDKVKTNRIASVYIIILYHIVLCTLLCYPILLLLYCINYINWNAFSHCSFLATYLWFIHWVEGLTGWDWKVSCHWLRCFNKLSKASMVSSDWICNAEKVSFHNSSAAANGTGNGWQSAEHFSYKGSTSRLAQPLRLSILYIISHIIKMQQQQQVKEDTNILQMQSQFFKRISFHSSR